MNHGQRRTDSNRRSALRTTNGGGDGDTQRPPLPMTLPANLRDRLSIDNRSHGMPPSGMRLSCAEQRHLQQHIANNIAARDGTASSGISLGGADARDPQHRAAYNEVSEKEARLEEEAFKKFLNTKLDRDKLPEDTPLPIYLSHKEPRKLSPKSKPWPDFVGEDDKES